MREPEYTPVMVVNSTHATLAAVNNGFGFSIVSSLAVLEHEFDQVYPARLTGLDTVRSLYMVRRTSLDSSVARAFGDWVLAALQRGARRSNSR